MAKERRGSIRTRKDGSIWARVTYVGNDGKRHELQRRAENRTQARFIIKGLLAELEERGDRGLDGQRMTFKELAAYYKEHKLIPAEYHGERKVAGLRAYKTPQGFLEVLVGCFGGKRIRDITARRGVDVVVDYIGNDTWVQSLRSARKGGRVLTCGATTGFAPQTDLRHIFYRQVQVIGSTMGSHREFLEVMKCIFRGKLKPVIDRVLPLSEARLGHELVEQRAVFGKIVLTPAGG